MGLRKETMYPGIAGSINRLSLPNAGFVMPELYFSDEEPETEVFGDLDEEGIEKELGRLIREVRETNDPERRCLWIPDNWEEKGNLLKHYRLYHNVMSEEEKKFYRRVRGILEREKVSLVSSAIYDAAQNRVIVYEKAFTEVNSTERKAAIRRAVAHEVFHAVHKNASPRIYFEDSYYADVVREALADFYSYVYCLDPAAAKADGIAMNVSIEAAKRRYSFWEKYLFANIPYPNAIFHMYRLAFHRDDTYDECEKSASIHKMITVLLFGMRDMHDAYLQLVPKDFRKTPVLSKRQKRKEKYFRGSTPPGVCEDGFSGRNAVLTEWKIIKKIIDCFDTGSLEELQECIPGGIVEITRGRFYTFASGEILSAYPQLKITDYRKFYLFAADFGVIRRDEAKWLIQAHVRTVLKVSLGPRRAPLSYLHDPYEDCEVKKGDTVYCQNSNGGRYTGTVEDVINVSLEEYKKLCDAIGYSDGLSIATIR